MEGPLARNELSLSMERASPNLLCMTEAIESGRNACSDADFMGIDESMRALHEELPRGLNLVSLASCSSVWRVGSLAKQVGFPACSVCVAIGQRPISVLRSHRPGGERTYYTVQYPTVMNLFLDDVLKAPPHALSEPSGEVEEALGGVGC